MRPLQPLRRTHAYKRRLMQIEKIIRDGALGEIKPGQPYFRSTMQILDLCYTGPTDRLAHENNQNTRDDSK